MIVVRHGGATFHSIISHNNTLFFIIMDLQQLINSVEIRESYKDFIGFYQNVFPEGFCEHVIEQYKIAMEEGICQTRQNDEKTLKTFKDGSYSFLSVNSHAQNIFKYFNDFQVKHIVNAGLQKCFDLYNDEYDILKDFVVRSTAIKLQKTAPGEGYHVWHFEQAANDDAISRCLVWAAYLNDVEDAGETEFLYQRLRVPPKKNTLIIWPAAFTHTHRGNVVHGNKSKYIMTGWFHLR